jgi:hypothetical protein
MKQQTAVEYFNEEILVHLNFDQRLYLKDIFEKSKVIFEKQIIDAHGIKMKGVNNHKCVDGKQYYQETFKSE